MNPSLQLLLVLLISFEVSFTSRLTANLVFLVIAIFVLLAHRLHWRQWLRLLAGPFLPALALFVTIVFYSPGHDWHFGFVLVSRIYLYVMLGATVTFTTTPLKLAQSLEQTAHLPAKFAYGTLSAVNLLPKIKQEVIQIRAASPSTCGHPPCTSRRSWWRLTGPTSWPKRSNRTALSKVNNAPSPTPSPFTGTTGRSSAAEL